MPPASRRRGRVSVSVIWWTRPRQRRSSNSDGTGPACHEMGCGYGWAWGWGPHAPAEAGLGPRRASLSGVVAQRLPVGTTLREGPAVTTAALRIEQRLIGGLDQLPAASGVRRQRRHARADGHAFKGFRGVKPAVHPLDD